jgi:uncharacterized protein
LGRAGLIFSWAVILVVACARTAIAIPSDDLLRSLQPRGYVNDFAGILSASDKAAIESRCHELEQRTGAQLAVVTLKTLEGGNLEDFSFKLAEKWGVHKRGQKNGLLLLVAMQEHQSRIEVGYDLEPIIPDVLAGRILDHQLRPQFRAGQFGAGLLSAVNALAELVEKGQPADRTALAAERPQGDALTAVLFISLFVISGGLIAGASLGSKQAGGFVFGSVFAGGPMLMAWAIAGLMAVALHLPLFLVAIVVGWFLARRAPTYPRRPYISRPGLGGWTWGTPGSTWGSSGGGWSGGGGFSGGFGGFGGGGGGFGGGGASGGW